MLPLVLLLGLASPARADIAPLRETPEQAVQRAESKRLWREERDRQAKKDREDADAAERDREAKQAAAIDAVNAAAAAEKSERNKRLLFETGAAVAVLGVAAAWGMRRSSPA